MSPMWYLSTGLTAGYVDLTQIGFVRPAAADDPGGQRLRAGNLAAIWRNYRAAGATHLVRTSAAWPSTRPASRRRSQPPRSARPSAGPIAP